LGKVTPEEIRRTVSCIIPSRANRARESVASGSGVKKESILASESGKTEGGKGKNPFPYPLSSFFKEILAAGKRA